MGKLIYVDTVLFKLFGLKLVYLFEGFPMDFLDEIDVVLGCLSDCAFFEGDGFSADDLLNELSVPVVVVDRDVSLVLFRHDAMGILVDLSQADHGVYDLYFVL